jgi:hypothetical protein
VKEPSIETYLKLLGTCQLLADITERYQVFDAGDLDRVERALQGAVEESGGSLAIRHYGRVPFLEPIA